MHRRRVSSLAPLLLLLFGHAIATRDAHAQQPQDSQYVTWTCSGEPCPWGGSTSDHALVWPESTEPLTSRLGYTTSAGVYLRAELANRVVISIDSGVATVYAGLPGAASHTALVTIPAGGEFAVAGLSDGEVLSVQSASAFTYRISFTEQDPPSEPEGPAADLITWNCTSSPCPWGASSSGYALVWPIWTNPSTARLGYTTSAGVYLGAAIANGAIVWVNSGSATLYAGRPDDASHRVLAAIGPGEYHEVAGLAPDEVLSVQSNAVFSYQIALEELPPGEDPIPDEDPIPEDPASKFVTWTCTGSPCPWGDVSTGHALVWPADQGPLTGRLGYTVSAGVYLPASVANGLIVRINSGTATLYAGRHDDPSHRALGTIPAGGYQQASGLAPDEVLSVQSDAPFTYEIEAGEPTDTDPPSDPPGDPEAPISQFVTWTCATSPCPWGDSTTGHALVWPSSTNPLTSRLGYVVSHGIYLPADHANGAIIWINSGSATLYAGLPGATHHRSLGQIEGGQYLEVTGLSPGEVLSVQSSYEFSYAISLPDPADPADPADPPPTEDPDGVIHSIQAYWRCNTPDCTGADWTGAVINWPSWAAYSSNNRNGNESRTVYDENGAVLYPYMGSWAHGCRVTARSGVVVIIEWQRGQDVWRETWLSPGETYEINLIVPEDGAMIEGYDGSPGFSVTLENCTPQPLP